MFLGVTHQYPFLTPPLQPHQVAQSILKALENNKSAEIKLPFYVHIISLVRWLFPLELVDYLRQVTLILFLSSRFYLFYLFLSFF